MIIKTLDDEAGFRAGDASFLKELLNPVREPLPIRYSLAHAEVGPGAATLPHRLTVSEVYYILEGRGRMHVGGELAEIAAGQAVCIPPGEIQFIENIGTSRLAFLCIVDPAWTPESEEVL
ncbi:MAG TPA: cupin domain-containing protein [Candidatus Aminicenantes bacterium]|nr:cupin domain-containing protein [Candidatus Aminicenantes bacterium]HRY65985.1 cupin domain-containing protein [Candidatus Aminicenantes bacterium]HRZ72966.1 cupin domain-containing protein [Candidatus Aminicenantes bacterium]